MKHFISLFLPATFLFWGCTYHTGKNTDKPVKIIFDTNLGPILMMLELLPFYMQWLTVEKQRFLQLSHSI